MSKKTIAVVFGGCSPEYDVSLNSAHSVINAINKEKFEIILIGITRTGEWYRYFGDISDIPNDNWHTDKKLLKKAVLSPSRGEGLLEIESDFVAVWQKGAKATSEIEHDFVTTTKIDIVFPVLHGKYGEDGTIQGLCELAGIPIVGSGTMASALCMDKVRSYKIVEPAGIKVPKYVHYEKMPSEAELLSDVSNFVLPIFVKPVNAGSSFGVTKLDELGNIIKAVKYAFEFDDVVVIEEGVVGKELGCAVFENTELKTGRVDEIDVKGGFFDYKEKYSLITAKIHMPARISEEAEKKVQETGKKIFKLLGCKGYARVDMFLTENQEVVFNEINTIPGFTAFSRFPNMCKGIGIGFEELVDKLINVCLKTAAGAVQ